MPRDKYERSKLSRAIEQGYHQGWMWLVIAAMVAIPVVALVVYWSAALDSP